MDFSPIITTASPKNAEALRKLGATHVLNRDLLPGEVIAEIKEISPQPLEYIFDAAMSDSSQQLAVEIASAAKENMKNQKYVSLVTPCTSVSAPRDDRIKIARVFGGASPHNAELFKSLYGEKLFKWLEVGSIVVSKALSGSCFSEYAELLLAKQSGSFTRRVGRSSRRLKEVGRRNGLPA